MTKFVRVEGAEGGDGELDCGELGWFGYSISGMKGGLAARGLDLGARFNEAVFTAGGNDNVCTSLCESKSVEAADAGAGPGDEGGFSESGREDMGLGLGWGVVRVRSQLSFLSCW